jgi:hypothetical protein
MTIAFNEISADSFKVGGYRSDYLQVVDHGPSLVALKPLFSTRQFKKLRVSRKEFHQVADVGLYYVSHKVNLFADEALLRSS